MEQQYCPYCMSPVEPGMACPTCGLTAGAYSPAAHHLPPGTVLKDRYLIGRVLGEGGFGITYIGCDLRLELRVAIKEYFPTDKANRVSKASLSVSSYIGTAGSRYEEGKERFLQEARAMAKMDKQPVIVSVRDFFEENNTAYIVMEYVDGTTFKDLVEQKGGRIPAGELLHIMEPLFSALSAMHDRGLIHRDISPENLMLENGEIRLLDFGCAREAQSGDATLTIALKHGYAPVEQYQNKGQGSWTDVYALSATIYYCLTGRKPPQSMDRLVEDELILPRKLGVDLTERQERALLHGMGIRPRRRFQSVQELHAALYEGVDDWVDDPVGTDSGIDSGTPQTNQIQPPRISEPPVKTGTVTIVQTPQKRETPGKALAAWVKKNRLLSGCGAAALVLVLAVLLAVLLPKGNREPPDPTGPTGQAASQPAGGTQPPAAPADTDPFANAVRMQEDNWNLSEDDFRALMADGSVPAVVIPGTSSIDIVGGPLEVTKPLLLEQGGGLHTSQLITVSGEGFIRIEGDLEDNGLVRTVDGGKLSVGPTGFLSGTTAVWMESTGDLTVEDGGQTGLSAQKWYEAPDRFVVVDEAALFANAVHVTTLEAYDRYRHGTRPIVIDGDLTFTDFNRDHTVPVLISEGVTITAPASDTEYCAWDVNGTVLINRGTIRGQVVTGDWDDDGIADLWKVINYGTIDGSCFADTSTGVFLNPGTVNIGNDTNEDSHFAGGFYNLGTVNVANTNLYLRDGTACNLGQILVEDGVLSLVGRVRFGNCGVLQIGANAALENHSELSNYGKLLTTDASARLDNCGWIYNCASSSVLDMHPDSELGCTGLLQYGYDTVMNFSNNIRYEGGHTLAFRWGDQTEIPTSYVNTEAELRLALSDESCQLVAINGSDITVSGDLTVTKGLAVSGSSSLKLSGGDLIVSGQDAFLFGDGLLDFGGGGLILQDGATAWTSPQNCGALTVRDGAMLVGSLNSAASIELDGGYWINLTGQELEQAEIRIENSVFRSCVGLNLLGCTVEIGEGGEFLIDYSDFYLDSATTVTNRGDFAATMWDNWNRELACEFVNEGWLELNGGGLLSGHLTNYGTIQLGSDLTVSGSLSNQGRIWEVNSEVQLQDNGTLTGIPPEPRDNWTNKNDVIAEP